MTMYTVQRAAILSSILVGFLMPCAGQQSEALAWQQQMDDGEKAVRQHKYSEAEKCFQKAIEESKHFDKEDSRLAKSLTRLAEVYRWEGKTSAAEDRLKQALKNRETTVGPDHPDVAPILVQLAILSYGSSNSSIIFNGGTLSAPMIFVNDIVPVPNAFSVGHFAFFTELTVKPRPAAIVASFHGDYSHAEKMLRRAALIQEKDQGSNRLERANTLEELATVYFASGAYDGAQRFYAAMLDLRAMILGPENEKLVPGFNILALTYRRMGKFKEAEESFQRALTIEEKTGDPQALAAGATLQALADLYVEQGRLAEAEPLLQRSINIFEKAQPGGDPPQGFVRRTYVNLLEKAGRKSEARQMEKQFQAMIAKHPAKTKSQ